MKSGMAGILLITVPLIFLVSVLVAATDAQGALVFLVSLPASLVLLLLAFWLGRGRLLRGIAVAEGLFLLLFVVSAFVPPLRPFPGAVMRGVAGGFTALTGVSPYGWARQRSELAQKVRAALGSAKEEVAMEHLPVPGWTKLCFFGPYSTEEDAARSLGYTSATLATSQVGHSDGVTALVFVNDSGTLAVIDVERSLLDFAPLSRECMGPSDLPLRIDASRTAQKKGG